MAKRNGNGHGKDETLETLKAILDVQREMVTRLGSMDSRLGRVETVLLETRQETRAGFADVRAELHTLNGRMEHVKTALLDARTDMRTLAGQRVQSIGERVARLEARTPETR